MGCVFTSIDLFSGIGGFRTAAEKCGGHIIAFSEINSDAVNVYVNNYAENHKSNLGDITKLRNLPPHDLLTAGVPCQSWSIAGKNLGFDDDRGKLWNDTLYLLNKSQPKAFIFENVKGLADPRNKDALSYIMTRIRQAGYFAEYYVLDSYNYGVPQSRVRIYIIGFREKHFYNAFLLPDEVINKTKLIDIIDGDIIPIGDINKISSDIKPYENTRYITFGKTSLSGNNNGFNDYFLFNDLRNGHTTIHSWDIINTTQRQKEICLLLLRNRRKRTFGPLDGNPLSLEHFQYLDNTVSEYELDELVSLGILKKEPYAFKIVKEADNTLSAAENFIIERHINGIIVPDELICDRELKINRININKTLKDLQEKGFIECRETRYEFKHTKISSGLFGINRIFLPSSDIFPTLVASDSNDYLTPVYITARNETDYKCDFLEHVLSKKRYRKISKTEALRIQGFPESFRLPDSRSRWMKLLGNSVSVPVIEKLIRAVIETGVFGEYKTTIKTNYVNIGLKVPKNKFKQLSLA